MYAKTKSLSASWRQWIDCQRFELFNRMDETESCQWDVPEVASFVRRTLKAAYQLLKRAKKMGSQKQGRNAEFLFAENPSSYCGTAVFGSNVLF